jgi:ABC-type lipoprotein export system ATPase subunit
VSANGSLFELSGVARRYRRGDATVNAVDGVDLTIGAGQFVAIEGATGADVIELLAGLAARRGTTIVVATHDTTLAARAPRRVAMRHGKVTHDGTAVPAGT